MPIINTLETFTPPLLQWNGHLQTIIPSASRTIEGSYQRERLILSDEDFVDLDWKFNKNSELVILTHGLEGSSERHYVKSPSNFLFQHGYDVLAWNCRSCSGELNCKPKLYHHGDYSDIEEVIEFALKKHNYKRFHLIGFSMGGNISIKYGACSNKPSRNNLGSIVSVSAPMHLKTCVKKLEKFPGTFYGQRFYKKLRDKIALKEAQFPGLINKSDLNTFKGWHHFDEHISAPLNGYESAEAFYHSSSSINFLPFIDGVPVLIINALNDPILSLESHPIAIAKAKSNVYLDLQKQGGHTGFILRGETYSYTDRAILSWLENM